MKTLEEQKEFKEKLMLGCEKAYVKLLEYKKQKNLCWSL